MRTPPGLLVISNHSEILGGGELSLLALLQGLDRSRWAPTVVVPSEGAMATHCRSMGIPIHVIALPTIRQPGPAMLRSVMALRALIRTTEAGLLHANGSRAMFYAGLAGRLSSLPVIWHVRVADRDSLLDAVLTRLASAVIVNSKAVGRRFRAGSKVRCIYNGVDLERFGPRRPPAGLRASLGLPAGPAVIASVGRFVPYKGYTDLLEAARLVRQAGATVHWILAGDGEQRVELEERRRALGLEAEVHFPGWREDVPDILALCDLFALPSLAEHFGRVLIEAMAMEKAVVATEAGGVPEIVIHGETGILVPPAQPKALAEAVVTLLEDRPRALRLGRAGRHRVESTFSLVRHVETVEALYREVLDAQHGHL